MHADFAIVNISGEKSIILAHVHVWQYRHKNRYWFTTLIDWYVDILILISKRLELHG